MKIFIQKNKKNSGFTLVETLVAISIFTISILGLLSILASGITNTSYAKQKVVAGYLAQEGIEYVRNMRDTYAFYNPGTGWASFNTSLSSVGCTSANGCYFIPDTLDYTALNQPMTNILKTYTKPCPSSCADLMYDNTSGTYGYSLGVDSGLSRKITVSSVSSNEIKVSSTVSWTQGSGPQSVTFTEDLYNWAE